MVAISYHDPGGGAQVQLDDEAVPASQEGHTRGGNQQTRAGRGKRIGLPSFREDTQNIQLIL